MLPPGPGYYSLTRHADVVEASKHPSSSAPGRGTNIGDMPPDFLEFLGSMINMDDPKHARMRRIVSRGFTPRQLDQMKGDVEATAAGHRRRRHRARRGRLRHRHRRHAPAADHRRHDGDPAQPGEVHLRPHERDPRPRRSRVRAGPDRGRRDDRAAHGRAGAQPAHHRARRGPGEGPEGRPHQRAGHRRGRRRDAQPRPSWRRSSSSSSSPATRPPATPSRTASSPSPSTPSSATAGRPTSTAWRPPPSRRSCAGPRR